MDKITCCNIPLSIQRFKGNENIKSFLFYLCPTCGKKAKGYTQVEAEKTFKALTEPTTTTIKTLAPLSSKGGLIQWAENNMPVLLKQAAQFIDKPATKRMIEKNIRYISNLSGYSWDKIWKSPEGQESISHAFSESLYYAATLPEMGSIVPYGNTAEFIPSVECFKFALETGKGAPFTDINIILIHENDLTSISQDKGNFNIKTVLSVPRGEVIAVCVYATRIDTSNRIGEVYDVQRLLEKAKHHSPAYRSFLFEKADFNTIRIEGKLKKDESGREYMEKKISKKDGSTWNKKIYEHDITNPYDGPDRPEMLKKSAGKTFFRPYMKVRNAAAMADEWDGDDMENEISRNAAADNVLNQAGKQFDDIKDAEIIPDDNPDNEQQNNEGGEKKDLKNNKGGLFNEEKINL